MERLTLLLLLTASFSSCTAWKAVIMDSSHCVHLRCEWRGVGKYCKSATIFRQANQQKSVPDALPVSHPFRSDESEASILARLQAKFPFNTFTLVNDFVVGEQCERKRLWCNGMYQAVTGEDNSIHQLLRHKFPPKFQC